MQKYWLIVAALLVGCSSRTYDISVKNDSSSSLNLWLTKEGGKPEKGWYTPEEFVAAPADDPSPGIQLEPGKTADTGKVPAHFPASIQAILLVSRSGAAKGGPPAMKVPVAAGKTELDVRERGGRLEVFNAASGTAPVASEP